ncbi:DJ-1/PfpI family protein [Pedobacter sp. GR22-6]|uniref:DJ-1/PfpI family protein n=1 Tax=Pedobacter sp. GR22-6 TaxID=3127957 RepID=UPI00307EE418
MKTVLLLLANGFEIFEASAFIDVIGWNYLEGDKSTRLFTCGITHEVASTFGQKMVVDFVSDEIDFDDFDALAIPGGFENYGFYTDAYSRSFSDVIKNFNYQKKTIASICTGALPIAYSGILIGRRATTYNLNPERQGALADFGAIVVQEPIVIDNNVITSWNPSTALDVAFELLENLTSIENANLVRELMGFNKK